MMKKICPISGKEFILTSEDLAFYKRMGVPPRTLHPDEDFKRRSSWRNERNLYSRKCDATGKKIVSIYSEDKKFPVYDQKYFWGDSWDPLDYGQDFDFSRPFFDQYYELMQKVPRISIINKEGINSDYCNYSQKNKNCYLTFGAHFNEDLSYVHYATKSKDCVDSYWLRDCELCYECVDCGGGYNLKFCQNVFNSSDSWFLKNCIGCKNCFGCVNLRHKEYYFLNQKCTKSEYEEKLKNLDLISRESLQNLRKNFGEFCEKFPCKYMEETQSEDCSGDFISQSARCYNSYEITGSEDCNNAVIVDEVKFCRDVSHIGFDASELCYELIGCSATFDCVACESCWHNDNIAYCGLCFHSSDLFGCISLKHKKYCILNKQYSREEYFILKEKIISHMRKSGEWGEFFPMELSPFGYNETVANEYFPFEEPNFLSPGSEKIQEFKPGLENLKYNWKTEKSKKYSGEKINIPDHIKDVKDDICEKIFTCPVSGKKFKIQKAELNFYKKMNLPLPVFHPNIRHEKRRGLRNPRTLFERTCDNENCENIFKTTFNPERKEKIFCEKCYLEVVD